MAPIFLILVDIKPADDWELVTGKLIICSKVKHSVAVYRAVYDK